MEFPFRTDSFLVYRFVKVYFQKSSRIFMDLNLKKKKKKTIEFDLHTRIKLER